MRDMAYAAIHSCGKIVAASVDVPDNKACAQDVASWIRRGEPVRRMSVAKARRSNWCQCYRKSPKASEAAGEPKEAAQAALLE